jgi:hypothetical protein
MIRRYLLPAVVCCVTLCVAAVLVLPSIADEKSAKDPTSELMQLRDKVAQLEARVAALEKKPPYVALPPRSDAYQFRRGPSELPSGWHEQMFNGIKYYIVPLGKDKPSNAESPKPLKTP